MQEKRQSQTTFDVKYRVHRGTKSKGDCHVPVLDSDDAYTVVGPNIQQQFSSNVYSAF